MGDTFTNLIFHLVFSTKDRTPLIAGDFQERLYEYIGGIVRGQGGTLLEAGGMPDHIHLLTKLKPDCPVATMVRFIKSNSTGWWKKEGQPPQRFSWQAGYGAFSVSESQIPTVRTYIRNQEAHHAKASFQDELIALLRKNRIAFEEKYLL
jgi:REP element-mobilizing transposase RayT